MFRPLSCRCLREEGAQRLCRSHRPTPETFPGTLEACALQLLVGLMGKSETDNPHPILVPAERDTESKHH